VEIDLLHLVVETVLLPLVEIALLPLVEIALLHPVEIVVQIADHLVQIVLALKLILS
jgi:hypothetical protein